MWRPRLSAVHGASLLVYGVLALFALLEKCGADHQRHQDAVDRAAAGLPEECRHAVEPADELRGAAEPGLRLPLPAGAVLRRPRCPACRSWVTERLWSVLVLVIGCEGARLVARAIGLGVWPAWVAGMAFGLNARVISQVGVRSAEVLPTAVLPWVVLPIVLALTGRLPARRAALFSAVAFLFSGAVNGDRHRGRAAAGGDPDRLGRTARSARWSLLGWWTGFLAVTNLWWAASLFALARPRRRSSTTSRTSRPPRRPRATRRRCAA